MISQKEILRHTKKDIEKLVTESMEKLGWERREYYGLRHLYAKSLSVAPYFLCQGMRSVRARGHAVEGAIGVLHQPFEDEWKRVHGVNARPSILLHTANFRELSEPSVILDSENLEKQVGEFCRAVDSILISLPHSEERLREAFDMNKLYRFPVDKFAGRDPHKLSALREFVLRPTRH